MTLKNTRAVVMQRLLKTRARKLCVVVVVFKNYEGLFVYSVASQSR